MVAATILFLLSNFKAGGAERQYFNLIQGIDRKLFGVHVGLIPYRENRPSDALLKSLDSFPVTVFERKHKADLSVISRIVKHVGENDIDLIQTLLLLDNHIGRLVGFICKKPVITSVRGEIGPIQGRFRTWFEFKMQVLSKKIVVNSHWLKNYLIQHGTAPEKIVTIYNGIKPDVFRSNAVPAAIRRKYNIPDGFKLVGIVARLHPMKDHRTFFRAIKLIHEKIPSILGLVVGDGELKRELQNYSKEIGIESHVMFIGTVTSGLSEVYKIMDVFLLTSQWGESFPNVILEAMSASVPVIATNISAIPEIIVDGVNGYLVEKFDHEAFANKAVSVLTDADLRNKFVTNGLSTVENFGVDKMVTQYEQMYSDIC